MRRSLSSAPFSPSTEGRMIEVGALVVLVVSIGTFWLSWNLVAGGLGALGALVLMAVVSIVAIRSTARHADTAGLAAILTWGLGVKLAGTLARYTVSRAVYGTGDSIEYQTAGGILGSRIHAGVWTLAGTTLDGRPTGTQAVARVLGAIYSVTGSSQIIGYAVFSWLGWLGLVCFYRAFRLFLPDVASKPFALLLFFLPTLVYWPSAIGKEALMLCLLGLGTLGIARLLTTQRAVLGLLWVVFSAVGIAWIRPHVALLLLGATVIGVLVQNPGQGRVRSRVVRGLVLLLLIPGLVVSMSRVDHIFGSASDEGVSSVLAETTRRTTTGGSSFDAQPVRSPADFPQATISVLLRPYPWQASGVPALIASLEGVVLVGLLVVNARKLARLPRLAWRRSGVAFGLAYLTLFIVAFSNIGNAGILARQRTQVMPFLLLAVCAVAGASAIEEPEGHESVSEGAPPKVSAARRFVPGTTSA